jgi:uncharacterized protein (TIGR03437 family)
MPQGGVLGRSSGSFLVGVSSGTVSYTATIQPGAAWLKGGGSGTASATSPGTVSYSIDTAAAAALPAGAYYATIRIAGAGIANSPVDFQVVLSISPAGVTLIPDPQPAGLLFISGNTTAPPQIVQLFASSSSPIAFQTSAAIANGTGWLAASPATGSTTSASPAQISVSVNAANLAPGVYRGTVSFAFASAVRSVNVTLIVTAKTAAAPAAQPQSIAQSITEPITTADGPSCANGQLVPTQTGLVSNFSTPTSWPTPLAITLFDSCGAAVSGAQIVATFSNGDPPLALTPVDPAKGLYSGTWTPRRVSQQITIQARVAASGYATATTQIAGQVAPNTAPVLAPNGTSDIFHPQVGNGLGPGNIVQIYGSGLASQTTTPAILPLPTAVNGTAVFIGGVNAPLYYVSPVQINAQVPFELAPGNQYQLIVSANGALTTPQPIQVTNAVPAILEFNSGAVVAQHQDGSLITNTSPAVPGEFVVIYLTGLGATDIPVPSGQPSPSNPVATVLDTPVLTLNDTPIPVLFSGLTPSLVGLYQINFQLPKPLGDGNYQLVISQSGVVSNQTVLAVKNPQ